MRVQVVDRRDGAGRGQRVHHPAHDAALEEPRGKGLPDPQRLIPERAGVDHGGIGERLDRPVGICLQRAAKREGQDGRDKTFDVALMGLTPP